VAANADPAIPLMDGSPTRRINNGREGARTVVAVAPLRIDLTGGFTDIPPFSCSMDSLHINAAFDLTVTVRCRTRRDRQVRVGFAREGNPTLSGISEGRRRFLEAVRAGVAEFSSDRGLDLSISSEAPAGSGLGSSGAILVAAINGCATLAGIPLTASSVAKKAIVAAAAAGIVGGQQDEFAAAHGSLRAYLFDRGGTTQIREFASIDACRYLEENLLVVQMGAGGRRTDVVADVVREVRSADKETIRALLHLQELAHDLWDVINRARFEELPRRLKRIRDAQCALHPRMCCPIAASTMEAVRHEIPEVEYKILGGGGAGACVLLHVPMRCRATAVSLLKNRAKRVLPIKINPYGVLTEFAGGGESEVGDRPR
jgi:D-glycero-alpha-D-manno-heptose-7-phosphate kinase